MVPPKRTAKRKQSVRDQSLLHPSLLSSRLPYEYDEVTGITQVNSREADSVEEGLDLECHDASENPPVPESPSLVPKPDFSHRGCGSSSLRECIELLNNTERNAPAALHSRVKKENTSDPRQFWTIFGEPFFGVGFSCGAEPGFGPLLCAENALSDLLTGSKIPTSPSFSLRRRAFSGSHFHTRCDLARFQSEIWQHVAFSLQCRAFSVGNLTTCGLVNLSATETPGNCGKKRFWLGGDGFLMIYLVSRIFFSVLCLWLFVCLGFCG